MGYESFRSAMVANLFDSNLSESMDAMNRFLSIMDKTAMNFDFESKPTDLILCGGIPEIVKVFIASKAVESRSDNTLSQYSLTLKNFFEHVRKPLGSIDTNDLRVYLYQYQSNRHITDNSLDRIRSCIGTFFGWAFDEGYIQSDPSKRIKRIKGEENPRTAMEQIELERMRSACKTVREKALVDFLYSTGCRISEVSNMLISDVDFDTKTVLVRLGKGKKSRTTYINPESYVSLTAYLKSRDDDNPHLFVSQRKPHHQILNDAFERMIRQIESRAQIKTHVTPHVFRHTVATTAISNGMPVEQVQQFLGHSNISTTMIYAEVNKKDVQTSHAKYIR